MDEFMLIFRLEDGHKAASPEEIQIWMKQTRDWIGGIAAQNKFVLGNGLLFEDSKVVRFNNAVTDGPFGEIKETVGGYVIVRAKSVDEAVEFAKGSPVLQGKGNSVEVRKIAGRDGAR
ncbi:MAG TPA: YciI family protein [Bacteroidota bacterium]|nr:YciI family protein [Bacteroidota bacterium]